MKRTTYIFIGVFITGLLLVVVQVLFFYAPSDTDFSLNGVPLRTHGLTQVSHIHVGVDSSAVAGDRLFSVEGELSVSVVDSSKPNVISCQQTDLYTVTQQQDCLLILFHADKLKEKFKEQKYGTAKGIKMHVTLNGKLPLSSIAVDPDGMEVNLTGLKSDSLWLQACGKVKVYDCRLGTLRLGGMISQLQVGYSTVDSLYMNLDKVSDWESGSETNIGHMFLSGAQTAYEKIGRECKHIHWQPLADKASLNLNLSGKSEITVH